VLKANPGKRDVSATRSSGTPAIERTIFLMAGLLASTSSCVPKPSIRASTNADTVVSPGTPA
jgi:hypothetical protein